MVQLAWHGFVQFELYYIYVVRVEMGVLCILYLTSRFLGPTIPALPPPSPHCKTRGSYHPHLDHHEFYVIVWRHKTTPSPPQMKKNQPQRTSQLHASPSKKKSRKGKAWGNHIGIRVSLSECRIVAMLKHTPTKHYVTAQLT